MALKSYDFGSRTPLSPKEFTDRFRDINTRIIGLEEQKLDADAEIAKLQTEGLGRINDVLLPAFRQVQGYAELGFMKATSFTPTSFAPGVTTLTIDDGLTGGLQALFEPTPFLFIGRVASYSDYAVARLIGYDQATGILTVDLIVAAGDPGPHTDLIIAASPGMIIDDLGALGDVEAARAAAGAAQTAAETAETNAEVAETGAEGAKSGAETAEANAAQAAASAGDAADDAAASSAAAANSAAAATGGSVKVSADDTANTEFLYDKLAVTGGIAKSVTNPGGDESLSLSGAAFLRKDGSVAATEALDMAGNAIEKASLAKAADATVRTTSTHTFNFNDGGSHKVTASRAITMSLAASNFPTGRAAAIIVEAVNWGSINAVSIPVAWTFAGRSAPTFTAAGTDRLVLSRSAGGLMSLYVVALDEGTA